MILTHVIIYQTHIIGLTRFFDFFWTEISRFEGKKKNAGSFLIQETVLKKYI